MQKLFILVLGLISVISFKAFSQSDLPNAAYTSYISSPKDASPFVISTKPVTNREYLTYLIWNYYVEGIDYPKVFIDIIPGNQNFTSYDIENLNGNIDFAILAQLSDPIIKNYLFNPKYIDYPVVGVNWLQANKYCKWLADRFNEYNLIKQGYYLFGSFQQNEECFVTESYLALQYYGYRVVGKEDVYLKWSNRILAPSFRLPSSTEIESIKNSNLFSDIILYKKDSTNFLNLWSDLYIKSTDSSLLLILDTLFYKNPIVLKLKNQDLNLGNYKFEELLFDSGLDNKNVSILNIYEKHNQKQVIVKDVDINDTILDGVKEKDSLGMMHYIIIGENKNKEVIAVDKYNRFDNIPLDPTKLYFFRFSCAMKLEDYLIAK